MYAFLKYLTVQQVLLKLAGYTHSKAYTVTDRHAAHGMLYLKCACPKSLLCVIFIIVIDPRSGVEQPAIWAVLICIASCIMQLIGLCTC